jgi:WD40 repeat protein
VSVAAGKVTLEQGDGTSLEIEVAKLSADDQKYVKELQAASENPFRKSESPFKTKSKSKSKANAPAAADDPPLSPVDWSAAKIVDANPASANWKLTPAPGLQSEVKPQIIRLPAKSNFFEKTKGIAVNLAVQRAVIGYGLDDPRPAGTTRLAIVDLAGGKLLGVATTSGHFAPVAISDDGSRVLMRRDDFGHGNHDRLELWSLDDATIRKISRWNPYDDARGPDRDVQWAAFLADGRLATCSAAGRLAVWELDPVRPICQLTIKGGCVPALSPNGKLIAFTTDKELGIFDAVAGQVLTVREIPTIQFPTLAFSPDGKRIACAGFDRLFVWDAASGELQRELPFLGVHVGGQVAWAGNDHVLVGGQTLFDLERQIRLWDYQGGEASTSAAGLSWFVAGEGERAPGALIAAKLPQDAVLARLTKAMAEPDFFVLKPGVTVTIDTSGLADADRRDKVAAALRSKLEANGFKVGENGTITLAASTEVGKERDVTYHTFGVPFGNKTYKVKEHSSKVQFNYQGKSAWQSAAGSIPFFVRLKEGETMEQYLKEHEKPNYEWFEKVELPKLLIKPTGGAPGLGTSRVTTGGLR